MMVLFLTFIARSTLIALNFSLVFVFHLLFSPLFYSVHLLLFSSLHLLNSWCSAKNLQWSWALLLPNQLCHLGPFRWPNSTITLCRKWYPTEKKTSSYLGGRFYKRGEVSQREPWVWFRFWLCWPYRCTEGIPDEGVRKCRCLRTTLSDAGGDTTSSSRTGATSGQWRHGWWRASLLSPHWLSDGPG